MSPESAPLNPNPIAAQQAEVIQQAALAQQAAEQAMLPPTQPIPHVESFSELAGHLRQDPTTHPGLLETVNRLADERDVTLPQKGTTETAFMADLSSREGHAPAHANTLHKSPESSPTERDRHARDAAGIVPDFAAQSPESQQLIGEVLHLGKEAIGLPTSEFVEKHLRKDASVEDSDGFPRPSFEIASRRVVFRNRQETPRFADKTIAAIGAERSPALPFKTVDMAAMTAYVTTESQKDSLSADYLVVTNTPEGLVAAAQALTSDETQRGKLAILANSLANKDYTNPAAVELFDDVLGAITIDDTGKQLWDYDTDGLAVELAALTGDEQAQSLIAQKREQLRANESERTSSTIEEMKGWSQHLENVKSKAEVGVVTPDKLALVHSTEYPIERDSQGNVVLWAASQKRDDVFPRASLHFTLNSQVAPHVEAQNAWGVNERLIVANLATTMEQNDRKPTAINGIDTWFVSNPGEPVTLPGALVVEGSADATQLIQDTDTGVLYANTDKLSDAQLSEITTLSIQSGIPQNVARTMTPQQIIKEVALRRAQTRVGVPPELYDMPSSDSHGMMNSVLATQVKNMALELGVTTEMHADLPEANFEKMVGGVLTSPRDKIYGSAFSETGMGMTLETRRQAIASGYIPANPPRLNKNVEEAKRTMVAG
jgi:hypothetical protein